MDIIAHIAEELSVDPHRVSAAIRLLDEGATVPFIARYRKEATNGLDDTQLRTLEQRLIYLRELDERRDTVLHSIKEQGKLTPDLERAISEAHTKTALEDLYLPFRPKRRTKAQIAREAGLEPLAEALLEDPEKDPQTEAAAYLDKDKGIEDIPKALEGARQILMERFSENAPLLASLRDTVWQQGILTSSVAPDKEEEGKKFKDYFDYAEPIRNIPSHRALALFRGRNEGVLNLKLEPGEDAEQAHEHCEGMVASMFGIEDKGRPGDPWLLETVRWTWKIKLFTKVDLDLKLQLRQDAEEEAIKVFSHNLKDLLLAAPAGPHATIGLDPGLRTGVKVAVVDATGKLLTTETIYPHAPKRMWDESIAVLAKLIQKHGVDLLSIGNGTASRETDQLVAHLIDLHPGLGLTKIIVSEAGASVYSASKVAADEFPQLDVSLRGAVSIARRLQDPLAELVKIEPKSIGVGQYQHDVNQTQLARNLDAVVEDCVNAVGVDVNTASVQLLKQVSGLNATVAQNIVAYRDENGAFRDRKQLQRVPRLGPKAFEQSAGFLRIMKGETPLDASAVHPEAYSVVEMILNSTGRSIDSIMGETDFLRSLNPADFVTDQFGIPTVQDILVELDKPGRDPRPEFKTASFREGVEKMEDLSPGMELEGVVTNVTNFGAFIDIGVHQDGLVHISQLADSFVKDPRHIAKAGDVVKVHVLDVDMERKRISLSMKSRRGREKPLAKDSKRHDPITGKKTRQGRKRAGRQESSGALAQALARALKQK